MPLFSRSVILNFEELTKGKTMSTEKYLHEIHNENKQWLKQLEFARDEIKTFKNRLGEITTKNTKTEVLAPAEHFQNQFIRHNEVIDELKHDINAEEHKIVENAKANNVATDHRKVEENASLVDRMDSFNKIWGELKEEYTDYLKKVL
jgi:molybdopterin synthase catalytic subunit